MQDEFFEMIMKKGDFQSNQNDNEILYFDFFPYKKASASAKSSVSIDFDSNISQKILTIVFIFIKATGSSNGGVCIRLDFSFSK